jgi:hypothetical protein
VGLVSTGAVVSWLSETAPEPDDPPPQATRNVDNKKRQTILNDACGIRFRAKAEALEKQPACEEICFILGNTVDSLKQSTNRLVTM